MKTLLIAVMMLFASTASQAQIRGIPFDKAVPMEDVEDYSIDEMYGILAKLESEDGTIYTYVYEVKAKGYYDALKELKSILDANDIKRGPDADDTYFRPNVDRDDYNDVVYELRIETGWIQEAWSIYDDEWKIFIAGNADGISVGVIHYKSSAAKESTGRSVVSPLVEEESIKVNERALYSGRANTDETSGSEGITEGEGNQGSITGSPDSDNYADGLSTGGGGINFSLAGRNPVSIPKPEYNTQVSGTIVVRIKVNRDGKVTSAEPGYKGTNILDENLLEAARKAALKARFNSKSDAAYTQTGTITYHFVL